MFLVPFRVGGTSKIDEKHCVGYQKQGVQKIRKNMPKVRFGLALGIILGAIFDENVICV